MEERKTKRERIRGRWGEVGTKLRRSRHRRNKRTWIKRIWRYAKEEEEKEEEKEIAE